MVNDLVQERRRAENPRVGYHRQPLDIADALHQPLQIRILHFRRDAGVAQQAAEHGQRRVQRIQTGGHLHPLGPVDRLPVGQIHAGLLQPGPSVGKAVFNDKILRHLSIDKGRDKRIPRRNDGRHVLYAIGLQRGGNPCVRPRRDLVDHAPRERHARLILHIGHKRRGNQSPFGPGVNDCQHAAAQLFAVAAAVVHAHQRHRPRPGAISLVHQRGNHAHGMARRRRTRRHVCRGHILQLPGERSQRIALFGDGKADHLQ